MTPTARQALDSIRSDPVAFVREVLGRDLWSKQRTIIESVRDHRRTAVRSAHGVGKTMTAAAAMLWYLAAFPGARVISTAPTFSQVKEQLWREVAVLYARAEGFFDGRLTDTALELGADWFAVGLSTDRPERFAGHHAGHLLLVVDEASGVAEDIFEAGESFLTSENARVLMLGNPTVNSGTFHAAFHRDRDAWNCIAISAYDSPAFTGEVVSEEVLRRLVTREWVANAERRWGKDSPLFAVRALGEFPTSADDTVCSLGDIELAQHQRAEPGTPVIVSCDPARFGSDESVIAVRRGSRVRIAATYGKKDLMETAGRILRVARAEAGKGSERPVIVVDEIGIGGGLVDRLREIGEFRVESFNAAAAARDSREYPNARSQAWFDFSARVSSLDLDADEQLAADLVAPSYKIDSAGRRVVEAKAETKRRLGRSPDRADAVLMAFAVRGGGGGQVSYLPKEEDDDEFVLRRGNLELRGRRYFDIGPGGALVPPPGYAGK